ncbi:hypothetical protein ABZ719_19050 [Streptomyces sp. NPDC006743]|uniref:hypothetical protein n=1 Tax=Streptomyces sp. NPDC006743 TaxID=3154480 RepID=UPI003453CD97
MKYRAVLLAFFLLPALWGVADLAGALTASTEVVCPGENVRDGEERPGPMRPGDGECSVLEGSLAVASRTYEEQRNHQSVQRRRDARNGALLMAYGAVGALVAWRATRRTTDDT